jgi:hypothetical protein
VKFTKIPETTFRNLQLNAGVLLSAFDPDSPVVENEAIICATSGGVSFTATPTFSDRGEGIDNCPKNMKELKKLDAWEIGMSGSYVTVDVNAVKSLISAADVEGNKITPRNDVLAKDFVDLWWVGDYSDENGETNGGFVAIHMMNTLSTGGFSIQSSDKGKGTFAFTYTAHYSMDAQDTVPFEVYVQSGTAEE